MSQQINLFEGGLVRAKDWFTLPFVAVVYVVAAGVMFYLYTGFEADNAQLQIQRNQAVSQFEAMQKKFDTLALQVAPVDNSQLETALKNLQARFEMQSQILAIFQQSTSGAADHLIDYMRALTAQQQPGLWLTGFKIEPASQHVSLSGQALQSEQIPLYLDLLSAQRVFAGTQFAGLQLKQQELRLPQTSPAATNAAQASASPTPEPAGVGKGAADAGSNAVPAVAAPVPASPSPSAREDAQTLTVYAFEVKGRDVQTQAKRDNTVSWDAFVRQTSQAQPIAGK